MNARQAARAAFAVIPFPMHRDDPFHTPAPLRRATAPADPAPRVLLVEDEPTIAVTLADDLAEQGCDVTHTTSGGDAIRLMTGRVFDAVVTDLRLPDADGIAVLRAAKRLRASPHVLVISAWLAPHHELALREGASATLQKPFDNAAVLRWLGGVLPRERARRG